MSGHKTKLTASGKEGLSLRTTVPAAIRHQLGLKEGDSLVWELDKVAGKWVVIVVPELKE